MVFRSIRGRIAAIFVGILLLGLLLAGVWLSQNNLISGETLGGLIGFGIIFSLLIYIAAAFVASRTTRQVERLRSDVREIAEGNLSHRSFPQTRDEMEGLTLAVDALGQKLNQQISDYQAEEDKLQAMLGQMSDGVVIADQDGNVTLINNAARDLFSMKKGEAIGRSIVQVIRHHQLVELWRQSVDSGEEQVSPFEMPQSRRFLQVIVSPLGASLVDHTLLLFQDFTDVRRLETVRRDFVSNISHELRTPLASLKALAETLQRGALDDRLIAERFLGQIETEVDALTLMVNELLELSRIESGRVPLQLKGEIVCEMLRAVEERMQLQAQHAGLEIEVDCPDGLSDVLVDRPRLEQVLVNLVHNAVKFSNEGNSIYLHVEPRDDGVMQFMVEDKGIGIPANDLPRVFERFYKTDRARTSGGTGLGLAIAKHLVEAHGGRIWAESVEGQGSSFFFTVRIHN